MTGGIFGDLAASTYLRNPQMFYKQLFDEDATLSEYGLSILATFDFMKSSLHGRPTSQDCARITRDYLRSVDHHIGEISQNARIWLQDGNITIQPTAPGMMLNRLATYYSLHGKNDNSGSCVMFDSCVDKEERYANLILSEIITMLRGGCSKSELLENVNPVIITTVEHWGYKERDSALCLLRRALDCFINSFDFGSAIHNAVRYPNSNTRQIASLTGLIAEAMYGCSFYFVKSRYAADFQSTHIPLQTPDKINEKYEALFRPPVYPGSLFENRTFFPKNCALTTVDRQTYSPYDSKFDGIAISSDSKDRILYAFATNWDDRFGFYLDDGWIYCYRSFYILGRFRIVHDTDSDKYRIRSVQSADSIPGISIDQALYCAFSSARVPEVSHFRSEDL